MKNENPLLRFEMQKEKSMMEDALKKNSESGYALIIKVVIKFGLVALAFYLLFGITIDWSNWKTYAGIFILSAFL